MIKIPMQLHLSHVSQLIYIIGKLVCHFFLFSFPDPMYFVFWTLLKAGLMGVISICAKKYVTKCYPAGYLCIFWVPLPPKYFHQIYVLEENESLENLKYEQEPQKNCGLTHSWHEHKWQYDVKEQLHISVYI